MFKRRKLLMLLILLLPVQGLASTHARMFMAVVTQAVVTMPCHEQQAAHYGGHPAADEGQPGGAHDTDAANHLCCHQVFYCAACGVLNSPAQKFSDVSPFVLPLATLFIPDAPDRPPRG
jgi:hypothetical protein